MQYYFKEIRLSCYDVFLENTIKKRKAFFSEPLLKYLWKFFRIYKPDAIVHHLRRTRSYPYEGETRYRALLESICELE